jgi:hypothetical protein
VRLHNTYNEYCAASPKQRNELLTRWLRVWTASIDSLIPACIDRGLLLPVIRSRRVYQCQTLCVHKPLANDLAIGVVVDRPDAMMYLVPAECDKLGLSVDGAVEAANANLRNASDKDFRKIRNGTYVSAFGDDYDSSRLLLIDRIRSLPVKGCHLAAVPNRRTLIITGSEDIAGLRYMSESCLRAEVLPRFDTGQILRLGDDRWQPWLPPKEHYYHSTFLELRVRSVAQDYDEQVEWLAENGKTNTDAFRASFMVIEPGYKSISMLARQACPTSLPKTDLVVFCDAEHPCFVLGLCNWDAFSRSMGDGLKAEGCWPERHLVSAFPNPTQLAAMELRDLAGELGPRSDGGSSCGFNMPRHGMGRSR